MWRYLAKHVGILGKVCGDTWRSMLGWCFAYLDETGGSALVLFIYICMERGSASGSESASRGSVSSSRSVRWSTLEIGAASLTLRKIWLLPPLMLMIMSDIMSWSMVSH